MSLAAKTHRYVTLVTRAKHYSDRDGTCKLTEVVRRLAQARHGAISLVIGRRISPAR